jgi:hypothetical protein
LAREPGKVTARDGACLGDAEQAGAVWLDCVIRPRAGTQTQVPCVGDGAPWVVAPSEKCFGQQASYLCDFYQVSESLAGAAVPLAGAQSKQWLGWAQGLLKDSRSAEVLEELALKGEPVAVREEEAPIRACFRYLDKPRDQLDYQGAMKSGLPIGSGEVESGHRSVNQERLKISGAWWREENAAKMLALRVTRANKERESYWSLRRQAIL